MASFLLRSHIQFPPLTTFDEEIPSDQIVGIFIFTVLLLLLLLWVGPFLLSFSSYSQGVFL